LSSVAPDDWFSGRRFTCEVQCLSDARGIPLVFHLTPGDAADCTAFEEVIAPGRGAACYLLADNGWIRTPSAPARMRPASIPAFRPDPIDTGGVLLIHYALKHWNAPTSFSAAGRLRTCSVRRRRPWWLACRRCHTRQRGGNEIRPMTLDNMREHTRFDLSRCNVRAHPGSLDS
jgi:hypothetical protein